MEKRTLSLIDANLNRAKEGLRVTEDIARFVLANKKLTKKLKKLRHQITLAGISVGKLVLSRKTDVGARLENRMERLRKDYYDIVRANFCRTAEALRVLEEFSKLTNVKASKEFKKIRFQLYLLEKEMIKELNKNTFKSGLYLIVCPERTPNCIKVIQEGIKGGVEIVQLRAKEMTDNKILALARRIRAITKKAGVFFIINDRIDIALAADVDGVHLGQDDLPIKEAKQLLEDKIIGISTHSVSEALKAQKEGADYIGLGPIFYTETKIRQALGIKIITRVRRAIKIPIVAIGVINKDNAQEVLKAGADCVAVISAICNAKNVAKAARELAIISKK